MMWNDIVKANCARANTTASQPSNISTTRRKFRRSQYLQKPNHSFRKLRPNQAPTLTRPMRRLYLRAERNRRASLCRTPWIQSQSPDDLSLHGAGLILAGQRRTADSGPGAKSDCDHVEAILATAALD